MGPDSKAPGSSSGGGDLDDEERVIRFDESIRDRELIARIAVINPNALDARNRVGRGRITDVDMLMDTGATDSCIREDVATALGLPVIGTMIVHGVNSERVCDVVAGIVLLPNRGQNYFKNLPLIVVDIDVPVILGMSEIVQGVLIVDGERGRWRWSLRHEHFDRVDPTPAD